MGQKGSKGSPDSDRKSHKRRENDISSYSFRYSAPATHAEPTRSQQPPPPRHSPSSTSNSSGSRSLGHTDSSPTLSYPFTRSTSGGSQTESLDKFFQKYKDESEDAILAAGMEQFCEDLGVNPTDFIVLVLAWKFQASEMCRFTREEFVNGCQRLKVTDVKSLKQKFPALVEEIKHSNKDFKELYNFTFSFGLDHASGQRALPMDMAIALWELVFTYRKPPLLQRWCEFLQENGTRGISRDTWTMFLPFINTIKTDFSNYDESEAWPSLFDDFVEQEQEKIS